MKYLLIFCCVICYLGTTAQGTDTFTLARPFEGETLFDVSKAPAKYGNEWGVILAQKTKLQVTDAKKGLFEIRREYRSRVKIHDRAALTFFSDFVLPKYGSFTMQVIKPNGRVLHMDTSDAVSVRSGVSLSTRSGSLNLSQVEYEKLAIKSLEIGDIVDYAYNDSVTYDRFTHNSMAALFTPDIWGVVAAGTHMFGSDFPTLTEEFEIEVGPLFYLNFRSLNGVPAYSTTLSQRGNKVYKVRMTDILSHEEAHFVDLNKSNPRVDYEISFCEDYRFQRSHLVLGQQGELVSRSNFEGVKKAIFMNCQPYKFPRKSPLKVWMKIPSDDPEEYMRTAYRTLQWEFSKYESKDYKFPSSTYANIMYTGLKKKHFEPEIVVCVPDANGGIDNVLFRSDLVYGIRVPNEKGEYIYSFSFKKCSSFDDWDYRVVGSKAYALKPSYNYDKFSLEEIELPDYEPKSNRSETDIKLKLDPNKLRATVNSQTRHHGELKTQYAEFLLTPFEMADVITWQFYGIDPKYSHIILDRVREVEGTRRDQTMEALAKSNFEVLNYKGFELENSGMEMDNDVLEYKETYVVGDLITQASEIDYVVDLGRLISTQITLNEKDLDRRSDVYLDFVRKYQYTIDFKIPEGYKMSNLTAFRANVKNEAGFFTVEININKNNINLVVTKAITTNYLPNSKWPAMVELTNAAYDFSQQKIVLTKLLN